ncbi:nucleotide exchange factor GrpE [Myxococcota bacterium]|nr:nucleotide exchange factor GrpE [Myxococcota bacterium]
MSENKREGQADLDQAMAEAVRAVEARERGEDPVAAAAKPEPEPARSASEAVTESLIKAKRELEQVLEQTQTEAKSLRDKWLRAAADLDNYKKRAAKEREEVQKFGNERLLKDFLPIIDDLDRVVSSAKPGDAQNQAFVDGVRLVLKKFIDQLEKHGVTTFATEGQPFDPNQQEAVQQVSSELPPGTVVTQLQRGYLLGGRLLRPALVTVSVGPAS